MSEILSQYENGLIKKTDVIKYLKSINMYDVETQPEDEIIGKLWKYSHTFNVEQLKVQPFALYTFLANLVTFISEDYHVTKVKYRRDIEINADDDNVDSDGERSVPDEEYTDADNIELEFETPSPVYEGTETQSGILMSTFVSQKEDDFFRSIFNNKFFNFGNIEYFIRDGSSMDDGDESRQRGYKKNEFKIPKVKMIPIKKNYPYSCDELAHIIFKFRKTKFTTNYEAFDLSYYVSKYDKPIHENDYFDYESFKLMSYPSKDMLLLTPIDEKLTTYEGKEFNINITTDQEEGIFDNDFESRKEHYSWFLYKRTEILKNFGNNNNCIIIAFSACS